MMQKQFGKLYIRKRTAPQWLTYFILVMPFFLAVLQEFLGLPSLVKYTIDVAWLIVLLVMLFQRRALMHRRATAFVVLVISFFLYVFTVYLFNYQSPFYFLWGFRNNFRFYIAFLAFVFLFEPEDVDSGLHLMDTLFWVNAGVSFFQYFFMGYSQDYLGGIFGVERGCNAYSIIFFGLVISKTVLAFMNGQEKAWFCALKCGTSLVIAALAELKLYFVIFIIILILAAMITRFSWRKFVLVCIASVLFILASTLLTTVFGDSSNLSLERIWELMTATSYATEEDLGRFTAIPTIARRIFDSASDQLFGFGLGNCDTSTFAICNTPFYQTYHYLHYTWFSSAFLFLETGIIGLTAYMLFFFFCFFIARRRMKAGEANELYCQISMIMAALCVILTFYNSSLRMEVGYIAYFALALPFIGSGKATTEKDEAGYRKEVM